MAIIRKLLDKKLIRILDLLLKNKEKYFHLSEISNASKTSLASTFRTINRLVSLGIIDVTVLGKMKIYRIASNDETKELEEVLDLENKKWYHFGKSKLKMLENHGMNRTDRNWPSGSTYRRANPSAHGHYHRKGRCGD